MTARDRHDLAATLPWLREGTAVLLAAADRLADDGLRVPSTLPGWTRAHVLGHVARNAEALTRLATWARTGIPTPMYADREQRAREIESSATLPPEVLRRELRSTAADLDDSLSALSALSALSERDEEVWQATVRSALGRDIPAAEIPWLRVREVWLHAVDLAAGPAFADLPADLVDTLLDDVTGTLSTRPGCPPVRLAPTDRETTWRLGPTTAGTPTTAEAPAAELLAWATGRATGPVPTLLPPWL
ncbi:maleylpyruvate isomerase family mycothiol-dependent enzyme [Streptomyces sp. NPDC048277]|uniref:maleylpyruvate isomerase family mycothiol-dependent enzyme n=1 Tax=Streptomyces sp. NPDC048277 TaxID=3155027 RepID=UPI00340C7802